MMIDSSGLPGTMSYLLSPEPCPAATGDLKTPILAGLIWLNRRSSPVVRAGPLGLWQCAQFTSSHTRARCSTEPVEGSSNFAAFGALLGFGAPRNAPTRVQ